MKDIHSAVSRNSLSNRENIDESLETTVKRIHELSGDVNLSSYQGKGRIYSFKGGYNPNSSSIGSAVFILSTKILAFSAAFGIVAGFIFSSLSKNSKGSKVKDQENRDAE